MEGVIKRINEKDSFVAVLIYLPATKKFGMTYTGTNYRNYVNWSDIKVGDRVSGLSWKDENRKLLDADSPVHLI